MRQGGILRRQGTRRSLPFTCVFLVNDNEVIRRTAVMIGAMWKETLGVEIEIIVEEYKVFLQSRFDKNRWDVVRLAWNADFNDASNFLEIFRSRSSNNDMTYSNPALDTLLDKATMTADGSQRRICLQDAERKCWMTIQLSALFFCFKAFGETLRTWCKT